MPSIHVKKDAELLKFGVFCIFIPEIFGFSENIRYLCTRNSGNDNDCNDL